MRDTLFARSASPQADFAINPGALASGGDDVFTGTDGPDLYRGGGGNDKIFGHDGSDRLFGGNGNDRIRGGNGDDVLSGGAGRDVFVFDPQNEGKDRISDFERVDHIRFAVAQDDPNGPRQYSDLIFTETHGGTEVAYGSDGATIFLAGVLMDQIDQSQFIFV